MKRTDGQLFADFLRGDISAFTQIVGRYETAMFNYFYRQVGRRDEAENLVQETFERVYVYRRSYDDRRSFRTWLFTVACNRYRDWLREVRRDRERAREAKVEARVRPRPGSPEEQVLDDDRRSLVREALRSLPQRHRDVLILKHFEDMKYEEIAVVQDCSVGTVKSRMHHAVQKIRDRLIALGLIAAERDSSRKRKDDSEP